MKNERLAKNDLGTLAEKIRAYRMALPEMVNAITKITASTIHQDLLNKTPVDTSKALSNWLISIGTLKGEEINAFFLGSKGSTWLQSIAAGRRLGQAELASRKQGQVIFISNSADYIKKLDDGGSKQQPAGFVYRAVLLGLIAFKQRKVKLNWKAITSGPKAYRGILSDIGKLDVSLGVNNG